MDEHISFSAKHKAWIAVKKTSIDENTDELDIARILISIRDSLDNKIFQYLEGDFDMKALEEKVAEIVPSGRANEAAIASALKEAKSPKMTKFLKELTDDKNKLEVYKGLVMELVLSKLKLAELNIKALDKYIDDKHRRLE
jgi:hypothetical protein